MTKDIVVTKKKKTTTKLLRVGTNYIIYIHIYVYTHACVFVCICCKQNNKTKMLFIILLSEFITG